MKTIYLLLLALAFVFKSLNGYSIVPFIKDECNVPKIEMVSENCPENPQLQFLAFEVLGFLFSELLPVVFEEICTNLGGSPELCSAGGSAISALISLKPGNVKYGNTGKIRWKVSKGTKESYVSIKTDNKEDSYRLEKLLRTYAEDCAKDLVWKKLLAIDYNTVNIDYATNAPFRRVWFQNNTGTQLQWGCSKDGTLWAYSDKNIDVHRTGGIFNVNPPYSPVQLNFITEETIPFYFNDGAYFKFSNGTVKKTIHLKYSTNYEIYWTSNGLQFVEVGKH